MAPEPAPATSAENFLEIDPWSSPQSYRITNSEGGSYSLWLNKPYVILAEKSMAPHSSTLAWKIPWMEKPGRLQSMGSLRVRHD